MKRFTRSDSLPFKQVCRYGHTFSSIVAFPSVNSFDRRVLPKKRIKKKILEVVPYCYEAVLLQQRVNIRTKIEEEEK
ncbi:hypothetical protein HanPSC8_Chr09g0352091 [Helianthus annuus]|nr:hypothetical protein HanPSC8_Chr09g0352091 [Helianthus annuus]